jgi:hypothetical protein
MANIVTQPPPTYVDLTGTRFMVYANRYREAGLTWLTIDQRTDGFDPVVYYLFCLSLELHLKSFIWLKDRISSERIKKTYRHDLERLWKAARARGINKYASATQLRDHVVALVGPYYKKRQFNYLVLEMVFNGYRDLKAEPRIIPTLSRLTGQMSRSFRDPILGQTRDEDMWKS